MYKAEYLDHETGSTYRTNTHTSVVKLMILTHQKDNPYHRVRITDTATGKVKATCEGKIWKRY